MSVQSSNNSLALSAVPSGRRQVVSVKGQLTVLVKFQNFQLQVSLRG